MPTWPKATRHDLGSRLGLGWGLRWLCLGGQLQALYSCDGELQQTQPPIDPVKSIVFLEIRVLALVGSLNNVCIEHVLILCLLCEAGVS